MIFQESETVEVKSIVLETSFFASVISFGAKQPQAKNLRLFCVLRVDFYILQLH